MTDRSIFNYIVLRYLVAEKGILHRDVSWTNILVNPREYPERTSNNRAFEDKVEVSRGTQNVSTEDGERGGSVDDGIHHNYQFISDIFEESRQVIFNITKY